MELISISNFKKRLKTTNYLSEKYTDKQVVVNLISDFDFKDTNNNCKFFKRNTIERDNIICLPLGVTTESENNIKKIKIEEKTILCSSQFSTSTRDLTLDFPFITYFPNQTNELYLKNIAKSKYVLSPHGFNPDCFRHWESMYLSAIPITLKHPKLNSFSDLPILFLDSWEQLTEKLLIENYENISKKSKEKLDINYWINLITQT